MVQLKRNIPQDAAGAIDYPSWLQEICAPFSAEKAKCIQEAAALAESIDSPALWQQGIEMASTLAELSAGPEAMAAALLFPAIDRDQIDLEQIRQWHFPVSLIIAGALNMRAVQAMRKVKKGAEYQQQIDRLRKMLIAMVNDVRVALVKLAERRYAIERAKYLSAAKQKVLAYEIMNVYAPLANRLGIGHLKWFLEDLAFRYLNPDAYFEIRDALQAKRVERETYVEQCVANLQQALVQQDVQATVAGRAKHIYSIWRKMHQKHLSFHQVYDICAIRIFVASIPECYQALSCVQQMWPAVPGEFDDYIASPKANGYQSIHTVIKGPKDKSIEVQIRTEEMHQSAELGVAAHWRYKEGVTHDADFESRIEWLRQLLSWQKELGEGDPEVEALRQQVISGQIYVLTPAGQVVDLVEGATPIDFAYHVHTEVGHRCRGAKVNGKMVPLDTPLHTAQQVEIITGKESKPSRDWITGDNQYVKTHRARQKIQYWFRQLNKAENVQVGKEQLQKPLRRLKVRPVDMQRIADEFNFVQADDLYAALATGDVKLQNILDSIEHHFGESAEAKPEEPEVVTVTRPKRKPTEMVINGVDNLLFRMARCCHPVPGDGVQGYITQGRGVTVHRDDCKVLQDLQQNAPERLVDVQWGESRSAGFEAQIYVRADGEDATREITKILAAEQVALLELTRQVDKHHQASLRLLVSVLSRAQLDALCQKLSQSACVKKVWR